jgi:signal transduction histidine kinase
MVRSVLLCDRTADAQALHAEVGDATDVLVDVVTDARRALEFAARTRPDVVVCRLPRGDFPDVELLTRLRASSPTSCIVVRVDPDDATLASGSLAAGAHAVVSTLDDRDALLGAIRSVTPGVVVLTELVARHLGSALAVATDESDRLGRELDELRSDVAHGSSAKADFLSNISHELRTPVTVAKGIAYVLRNPSIADGERTEFLDQLQGSLDKLMGVLDEIITMSELERGALELDLADADLAETVRRAVAAARRRHPSVPFEASIAPVLRTVCDEARLEGVITELLDNACRYSPEGVAVEVSARAMSEGVVVSVTDRGEGLDRTVARRSFDEPFSTGEGVLRKEKAGIGVGLHLARQLVVEHGGTLWTDPLPGGGTRAAFCIPPVDARVDARSRAGSAGAA